MLRRIILASTIALTVSATAAAAQGAPPPQGPPGPAQGPAGFAQRRMQVLLQGITLSAAQQTQVDSIRARYAAQMPAFTPGSPPSPEDRQRRRELTQQHDAELRAVLTPEQQQVWDRNVEQMRANAPQRPGN